MARGRRSGRGPDYDWLSNTFSGSFASGGAAIGGVIGVATQLTLMRMRGAYVVSIDGPADGDKCNVGLGIIVASDEAVAAGVASIPSPVSDAADSWIWHQFVPLQAQAGTGVGASLNAMSVVSCGVIDSKAMRRLRIGDNLVLVMETISLAGAPAVDITGGYRALTAA